VNAALPRSGQRCQFHLARNAIHHAPNVTIRRRIGAELREVWTAGSLARAETAYYRRSWRNAADKAEPDTLNQETNRRDALQRTPSCRGFLKWDQTVPQDRARVRKDRVVLPIICRTGLRNGLARLNADAT